MKYVIYVFYQGHSTQLTWKDGLWYGALISRDHTICAELLKDVPFTGADLSLIQAQEVSSSKFFFFFNRVTCKQAYKVQSCELKFALVRGITYCMLRRHERLGKLPTCSLISFHCVWNEAQY